MHTASFSVGKLRVPFFLIALALFCAPPLWAQPSDPSEDEVQELQVDIEQDPTFLHSIPVPTGFRHAMEEGSRTDEGRPGKHYWQQESTYRLNVRLDPANHRITAQGRFQYVNNSPDTLYQIYMDVVQNFHAPNAPRNEAAEVTGGTTFSRLAINGQVLQPGSSGPRYQVEGTQLIITTPEPIRPKQPVELEAEWSFTVPQAGAGERMGYSQDNLFFIAYWYPVFSVYDDVEGWEADPFLGQAEFYYGFADYEVNVEVPAGWIVAATGELQNAAEVLAPEVLDRMKRAYESDSTVTIVGPSDFGRATLSGTNGHLTWRFNAARVRDFAFSATRASVWDASRVQVDRGKYVHVNTFYRPSATLWSKVTDYQQHAIRFLSEYTGFPYPYPHITTVEGADIIGGGMEYPMMTLIGDYSFAGADALYDVTAHELAHMWIPMVVSTDERRYAWMDEGSTTFAENQARNNRRPDEEADLADLTTYTNVALQGLEGEIMRWSNYHYSPIAYVTASYPKPAMLLSTLRALLGEETFNQAYRGFIADWAYKHPYPQDLFNAFEHAAGQDLDWFWNAWYYQTWTLDQAVKSVRRKGRTTEIQIENVGKAPMPVRLAITFDNGVVREEEIPVDEWLTGARYVTLKLESDRRVEQVEIDPKLEFPDLERGNNLWTR